VLSYAPGVFHEMGSKVVLVQKMLFVGSPIIISLRKIRSCRVGARLRSSQSLA
jgi:hypothetical protein